MIAIVDMSERDVIVELERLTEKAGPDELRVMLYIARRFIGLGREAYGELKIANDSRDPFKETSQEAADGLFYMSLAFLKAQLRPRVKLPQSNVLLGRLVHAAIEWSMQGSRSHWTTKPSLALYDAVQQAIGSSSRS